MSSTQSTTQSTTSAESSWLAQTTSVSQTAILTVVFAGWVLFAVCLAIFIARRRARMRRSHGTLSDLEGHFGFAHSHTTVEYRPSTRIPPQDVLSDAELQLLPTMEYAVYQEKVLKVTDSADEEATACVVCLDVYTANSTVRKLACGHAFHPNCIDKWLLKRSCRCPLCNSDTRGLLGLPQRPSVAKLN
ncbi:hypothetical protein IWW38_001643 [Coemansia aciculifera]|uniref:Uncharacterized protein n=1 Tax=Coemansia aciculifera TaxID=417176 RepID=A0ACC1M6M2_9FUNG|nr:hypothetical protein IWW38_001643 [Coemansia aciculifera]